MRAGSSACAALRIPVCRQRRPTRLNNPRSDQRAGRSPVRRALNIAQIIRPRQRRTVRVSALRIILLRYVPVPALALHTALASSAVSSSCSSSASAAKAASMSLTVGAGVGDSSTALLSACTRALRTFAGWVALWISLSLRIDTCV